MRNIRLQLIAATCGVALLALAALAYADPFELHSAELRTLIGGYAGIGITLFCGSVAIYYVLGAIVAPKRARGVADLSPDGDRLSFYNTEYQRLFLDHGRGQPGDSPGW